MKKFFRDYFSFNQVELKGIRVLLVILVVLVITYFLVPMAIPNSPNFDASIYQAQVDSFMASATIDTSFDERSEPGRRKYTRLYDDKDQRGKINDFIMKPFDPNGLPLEVWMQMGLSQKQAQVIKNYEAKGGKFRTKEDVKKQFVISEEFYRKIEPYIVFTEMNNDVNAEHVPLSVDINHATKEDFMLLDGVKDYLAEGIVKYREKLGGFTTVDQLKEVKYLSERIFNTIRPHCLVTPYTTRKVNINLAEWKEFATHPYIGGELAYDIIDYRKQHGIFKNAQDFKQSGLVDEALYAKLVPYLSFTH